MKSVSYGLSGTHWRVYIHFLYKMPLMGPFAGIRHPMRVSTKPFFGRNEL